MRAARFSISGDLLRQVLHMPEGSFFIAAMTVPFHGAVEFVAVDEALPEADQPSQAHPVVTLHADGTVHWDWNLGGEQPSQ